MYHTGPLGAVLFGCPASERKVQLTGSLTRDAVHMCHSSTGLAKPTSTMWMSATAAFIYKGVYPGWLFQPLVLHILMHSWSCPSADSVRNRQNRIACSSECFVFGFYEGWQHMWWSNKIKCFRPPGRPKGQSRQSHTWYLTCDEFIGSFGCTLF